MTTAKTKKFRVGLIGSDSLEGREVKSVLSLKKFPLQSIEFYDPEVVEEFGKLTQFRDEPKVVHHLEPKALEGLDLVFLAADAETSRRYGSLAKEIGYRAVDLSGAFSGDPDVPLVVAGVNDDILRRGRAPLAANPGPAAIMLAHILAAVRKGFGLASARAFVLEPASAHGEEAIQELADQSLALLGGSSVPKKLFRDQIAFNLLARTDKTDRNGFSGRETRAREELRRIFAPDELPVSLSVVLAPVFHTYSIMTAVELERDTTAAGLEACLAADGAIRGPASGAAPAVSPVAAAGKDPIFVGRVKKDAAAGTFWIWAVADNLTAGSAVNAYGIARALLSIT